MINSSQGFFETLVVNRTTKKQPETIRQETKQNNTELCNKIYDSIDNINKEYFIPSQFPNITKIKLIKKEPFIQFTTQMSRLSKKSKNKSESKSENKFKKNKSLKKNKI